MSFDRTAREAPPEFGWAAGAMTGSRAIEEEVHTLLQLMRGDRSRPPVIVAEPAPEIPAMNLATVESQTRTLKLLAKLREIIEKL